MRIRPAGPGDLPAIRELLRDSGLPADDVGTEGQLFLVARDGERLRGCIGLEMAGEVGLLRSLVVAPEARGAGVGRALHDAAVGQARERGGVALYALTITIRDLAIRWGFEEVPRDEVPASIRAGAQFRSLCPATATCLRLRIGGGAP